MIALAFPPLCATCAFAQRSPADMAARDRAMRANERAIMRSEPDESTKLERRRATLQLMEDFKRLQITNKEVQREALVKDVLDYGRIAELIADINKRAKRLKTNLVVTTVTDDKEKEEKYKSAPGDSQQMRSSLMMLDELILSFIGNPLFKQAGSAEKEHLAKVGSDLAAIIELSSSIKKGAEKLKKAAEAP